MNNQSPAEIFLIGIGAFLIILILYIVLTRYVHAIEHRKANEYAQTKLLVEIARKFNVEETTISGILFAANIK